MPPPSPPGRASVGSIGIGIDGTCVLMVGEGWRQAMVGTIALYDPQGEPAQAGTPPT